MKNPRPLLTCGALLISACHASLALADVEQQQSSGRCEWVTGTSVLDFVQDLGTLYIPKDAKVGSVIGTIDTVYRTLPPGNGRFKCYNDGNRRLEIDLLASAPIYGGPLDPINGEDVTGKILETNIRGVGIRIRLGFPLNGISGNSFHPVDGRPIVPYQGFNDRVLLTTIDVGPLNHQITLVKTDQISPGPNQLNGGELFSGYVSDLGHVIKYAVTGIIIPAQCTLRGNPVSADPVQLGDWDAADFTGPGYTTTAVPFTITLSDCDADTSGALDTTANIKLDGVKGSVPVGPATSGVFSLTTDSTAQGVGIQILRGDGITPIESQTEVPLQIITPGTNVLNFNARFYQTDASSAVSPGSAKGALNFTLTYK